jgi:hypothetical protein
MSGKRIMSAVATVAVASPVARIVATQPAMETTATCPPREAIAGAMATSAHAVPAFGRILPAQDPRHIQFGLKLRFWPAAEPGAGVRNARVAVR